MPRPRHDRRHIVVTGGAGFIGSVLAAHLHEQGYRVTVADLRPHPVLTDLSVVGDLRDGSVLHAVFEGGVDAVVHLAATTSVVRSVADPAGAVEQNVVVTAALLEMCRRYDVRSFVLASTNAVVGDVGQQTITEETVPHPRTPYGASKAAAEMVLAGYAASYGIAGSAVRLSNVAGPGMQAKDTLVARILRAARSGAVVDVRGDGTQVRDYMSTADAVRALVLALEIGHTGPLVVGSGRSVSVNEVIDTARVVTGAALRVRHVPVHPLEMPAVRLDISAARRLGYRPNSSDLTALLESAWGHDPAARVS